MIKRGKVPVPRLPEEEAFVASLGDTVLVRGLPLSFILEAGANPDFSFEERLFDILHRCVLADDGLPVYAAAEWDTFAGSHREEVLQLLTVVKRLSGMDKEAVEKNVSGQS